MKQIKHTHANNSKSAALRDQHDKLNKCEESKLVIREKNGKSTRTENFRTNQTSSIDVVDGGIHVQLMKHRT